MVVVLSHILGFLSDILGVNLSFAAKDSGVITNRNLRAFLKLIRTTEGTEKMSNPYAVVMGYGHTIKNFSNHPYFTGEWKGASFSGGFSTAAGAYQFLKATWLNCKSALLLKDFSKASQDRAAVFLIRQRGAYDNVISGQIKTAISKCNREWASLPGSPYGQPVVSLAKCLEVYKSSGGTLTD